MCITKGVAMAGKNQANIMSQQEFLRDAMRQLDMTRPQFAERIGTKARTLDNWLLPSRSNEFRAMPDMVGSLFEKYLLISTKNSLHILSEYV